MSLPRVFAVAISALGCISTGFGQPAAALPAETVRNIEQQVSSSMSKYHLPAASVAVVMDDKLVWSEGGAVIQLATGIAKAIGR